MKEEELTIRCASKEDLPTVYAIEKRSFKDPYPPFFIEMLLNLNPTTFLVGEREKHVIGYVVATRDRSSGHIVTIAVTPDERGKMVGRRLLERAMEILRKVEVETVRLEVRKSNRGAQRFYEALGFEYNHEVSAYYGDEDALVYYKKL